MATTQTSDGTLYWHAYGTASVGASSTADLATVTIPDGYAVFLEEAAADMSGTTVLSAARAYFVEAREGTNVELVRAAHASDTPHERSGVVYENTTGGNVVLALVGYQGDAAAHDMTGHMTWREIQ